MKAHRLIDQTTRKLFQFNQIAHVSCETGLIVKGKSVEITGVLFVKNNAESRFLADKDFEFQYKDKTYTIKLYDLVQFLINAELAKHNGVADSENFGRFLPKDGKRKQKVPYYIVCDNLSINKLWEKSIPTDIKL